HSGGDFLQETLDASQVRKPCLFESVSQSRSRQALSAGSRYCASRIRGRIENSRKRSGRQIERYWLCDGCSSLLTLTFDRGRGIITLPLLARNTPAHPQHLRQMQPAKTHRAELKGAL